MEHRRVFIGLRGFDYSTLLPQTLNIVPPADILEKWRQDYKEMQNSMIYGDSPTYEHLIEKLRMLNDKINKLEYWICHKNMINLWQNTDRLLLSKSSVATAACGADAWCCSDRGAHCKHNVSIYIVLQQRKRLHHHPHYLIVFTFFSRKNPFRVPPGRHILVRRCYRKRRRAWQRSLRGCFSRVS